MDQTKLHRWFATDKTYQIILSGKCGVHLLAYDSVFFPCSFSSLRIAGIESMDTLRAKWIRKKETSLLEVMHRLDWEKTSLDCFDSFLACFFKLFNIHLRGAILSVVT